MTKARSFLPENSPRRAETGDAGARDSFAHVETFVFDLDNTLYPSDCDLWPKIDARITLFMMHRLGLDGLSSRALQKHYYHAYGTTLRGLMQDHDVGAEEFLAFVHDIDRSTLLPNLLLAEALTHLPGRKLILTNGSRDHALQTAKALGLEALFEAVFDIADADFVPKPHAATYERFFDKHQVDPLRSALFEDLSKNLIVPHQRGMKTVLVVPKPGKIDHRDAIEKAGPERPPHVDFITSDLENFLLDLLAEDGTDEKEATPPQSF
ncbi:pyrimidine 5'-nucleotidase [Beijerinckia mobilis]|uniref:pyrimidine 5'-nucleotidase n=1 Tax=Beijerinckia mobilis TaxID=231434 RepID=UPI000A004A8B|nr:pyrimidine 5'-nucleotidase [Beijerinckia mobilis]